MEAAVEDDEGEDGERKSWMAEERERLQRGQLQGRER